MKVLFLLLTSCLSPLISELSAQGVKPLPTLHVEGRWLVDSHGNHVVLHGVMDTPNNYFNGDRWRGSRAQGWWDDYNDTGVKNCTEYFEKLFVGLEQAHCDVFRLHMDPAWTNDPNRQSDGKESGEADISRFSPSRLKTFLRTLYFPLAKRAMNHGMYVVVRPPGVCPGSLQVGDAYNKYLLNVWNIFTQNDSVKKYSGQISIELANEPVSLKNAQGEDDPKALHDFFQPIVDKIRANGFEGVIWVPGTGWQANYTSYATNPIEGYNIGYAVHDYCGWYGSSDDTPSPENKIRQFHKQVPVVDFAPVIITEVDWSPKKEGTGHYNEHGDWVESNYGTWATGSTSKWGKAYKACLDHFGNISMTLSGTGCLIDIDQLLKDGSVVPAFGGLEEACGKACMDWYADYYKVDWPHADDEEQPQVSQTATALAATAESLELAVGGYGSVGLTATFSDGHTREVTSLAEYAVDAANVVSVHDGMVVALRAGDATITATYTDPSGQQLSVTYTVRSTFFPFAAENISTSLFSQGTYDEKTHTFKPGEYGQMGWEYQNGADMSGYKYLVIKLKNTASGAHLNLFTAGSIWSDCYATADFGSKKQVVVNLQTAKYTSGDKTGKALDTKNIRIVSFWSNRGTIIVDDMYLTNNSDYSRENPTAIGDILVSEPRPTSVLYDLSGRRIGSANGARPGIYIRDGKKVIIR
ncbi:MAG: cellulase family glycosylhydrolase [Prevotella sp.]|nr:cellulase family glycosylhydrolase [Prevotella sp.]